MSEHRYYEVLISPDPVYWLKDREQILILDEQRQEIYALRGVEVAVWDWLTLAYSYPKIVRLLTAVLGLPSDDTEKRLRTILQKWRIMGILQIEAG